MSLTPQIMAALSAGALLVASLNYRRTKPKLALSFDWYTRDGYAYFKIRIINQGGAAAKVKEGVTIHARHRKYSSLRRKYSNGIVGDLDVIEGGEQREIDAHGGIEWVARTTDLSDLEALKRVSRFRIFVEQTNGRRVFTEWLYQPGKWFWALHNATR